MNKTELIAKVAEKTEETKKATAVNVDAVFETILEELAVGGEVNIAGFGKFTVVERAEREGRNPATSEKIIIPASKSPKFKAASAFKTAVNA